MSEIRFPQDPLPNYPDVFVKHSSRVVIEEYDNMCEELRVQLEEGKITGDQQRQTIYEFMVEHFLRDSDGNHLDLNASEKEMPPDFIDTVFYLIKDRLTPKNVEPDGTN